MNFVIAFMNAIVTIMASAGMKRVSSEREAMTCMIGMNSAIDTAFRMLSETRFARNLRRPARPGRRLDYRSSPSD